MISYSRDLWNVTRHPHDHLLPRDAAIGQSKTSQEHGQRRIDDPGETISEAQALRGIDQAESQQRKRQKRRHAGRARGIDEMRFLEKPQRCKGRHQTFSISGRPRIPEGRKIKTSTRMAKTATSL